MRNTVLLLFSLALLGCTGAIVEDAALQVYFCPQDPCEEMFLELIRQSNSIDCALYDLKLPSLFEALEDRNVRIVTDPHNEFPGAIVADKQRGLMHHKFCIFDNSVVFTGSWNPTERGTHKNNNNVIVTNSSIMVNNFRQEFNRLIGNKVDSRRTTWLMNNDTVQQYFCPKDACEEKVLHELENANHSIFFMTFSFTSDPIGDLIVEKARNGIEVRGIFEKSQNNKWTELEKMQEAGLNVHWDKNKYNMHHKVFIIDNETVIAGSYNPTNNGNKHNDENVLILREPDIVKQFLEEFDRLY